MNEVAATSHATADRKKSRQVRRLRQTPATAILFLVSATLSLTLAFHPQKNHIEVLASFGWADATLLWHGELWRLWVNSLLHTDIFHFLFNAYWLLRFGPVAEEILGRRIYFVGLLLAGWGVGLASNFSWEAGGIGLSGLIYFLFGFLWLMRKQDRRAAKICDQATSQLMWVWLIVIGPALSLFGVIKIGNLAHLSGLLFGLLLAELWQHPTLIKNLYGRATIAACLLLVMLAGSLYLKTPIYDADWHYWKAYQSEQLPEQIEHYAATITLDPTNHRARYNLGLAYYQGGQLDLAEQTWLSNHDRQAGQALFALYSSRGDAENMALWAQRLQTQTAP